MTASERRRRIEALCRQHRVSWTYAACDWCAYPERRHVVIPPTIDEETEAVAAHELAHVLAGPCPGGRLHFDRRRRLSASCLQCEHSAWAIAKTLVPFGPRHYERMRTAFQTYRDMPAPYEAQQAADRALGKVAALEEVQKRKRFEDMQACLERARKGY